jgi:biopolymer transport protein ExbD
MLANQTFLKSSALGSAVESTSFLKPKAGVGKRNIVADLLLTALIDAFSILVIFLLMSFSSTGDILFIGKGTELPKAQRTDVLERHPVVKIEEGTMYLEDKVITNDTLVGALLEMRKKFQELHPDQEFSNTITIQADRRVPYVTLNAVVLAASHAGISDVNFAVLVK